MSAYKIQQVLEDLCRARALIPMYMPLKLENCKKCGKLIAQPEELIRILKGEKE